MLTKNNWLTSNIDETIKTHTGVYFKMIFDIPPFKDLDFQTAADEACKHIRKDFSGELYLSLSGGLDSEFILRCFHRNNIKITPLIVICEDLNPSEDANAINVCNELNIKPVIINVTLSEFYKVCVNIITRIQLTFAVNSVCYYYTQKHIQNSGGGTLIDGTNMLPAVFHNDRFLITCRYEHLQEQYGFNNANVAFYFYTPELVYSMFPKKELPPEGIPQTDYKVKLYGLKRNIKTKNMFSDEFRKNIRKVRKLYNTPLPGAPLKWSEFAWLKPNGELDIKEITLPEYNRADPWDNPIKADILMTREDFFTLFKPSLT